MKASGGEPAAKAAASFSFSTFAGTTTYSALMFFDLPYSLTSSPI